MSELNEFPIHVKIPIAWGEMDAFGHVNNIYYLRYFEAARIEYFQKIGIFEMKYKRGIGPVLAQSTCKYHRPLTYPDQLVIGAKIKSMSKSSFVMEYIIVSEKLGVAATGEGVIVIFDYNNSKKAELPLATKEAIEMIEKEKPAINAK